MRTLLVLRHAKSSWDDSSVTDHDRPLNARGKRDAPVVGERLREAGLVPDHILCSTAKRAVKTVRHVVEACGYGGEVERIAELYGASPSQVVAAVRGASDAHARVLVVGHNPGLENLVTMLTSRSTTMPTAALAQVELDIERWADLELAGQGRLVAFWCPHDLADD